jgi:hypothetical protein
LILPYPATCYNLSPRFLEGWFEKLRVACSELRVKRATQPFHVSSGVAKGPEDLLLLWPQIEHRVWLKRSTPLG